MAILTEVKQLVDGVDTVTAKDIMDTQETAINANNNASNALGIVGDFSIEIGTVEGGDDASATITGTSPNYQLNLVLPKGEKGEKGEKGDAGENGASGGQVIYDLIIRTQEEFTAFVTSIANGTCTASSVLFVGNGGTLEFTHLNSYGIAIEVILPTTLKRLDGINNAKLQANIHYETLPTTNDYSISNLHIKQVSFAGDVEGFTNFINVTNCSGTGFLNCENLINCYTETKSYGFESCNNLVNCKVNQSSSSAYAFWKCNNLTNCTQEGNSSVAFHTCNYTNNCRILGTATNKWYGTNLKRDDDSCDV